MPRRGGGGRRFVLAHFSLSVLRDEARRDRPGDAHVDPSARNIDLGDISQTWRLSRVALLQPTRAFFEALLISPAACVSDSLASAPGNRHGVGHQLLHFLEDLFCVNMSCSVPRDRKSSRMGVLERVAVAQRKGEASFWKPYLDVLPRVLKWRPRDGTIRSTWSQE